MKDIDPDVYYSAKSIVDMKILPWKSRMTFYRILEQSRWQKVFSPIIERKEKLSRYYLKGENIISFLKLAQEGKLS